MSKYVGYGISVEDDAGDAKLEDLADHIDKEWASLKKNREALEYLQSYQKYQKASDHFNESYLGEFFGPALASSTILLSGLIAEGIMKACGMMMRKENAEALAQFRTLSEKVQEAKEELKKGEKAVKKEGAKPETLDAVKTKVDGLIKELEKVKDKIPTILQYVQKVQGWGRSGVIVVIAGFLEIVLLFTSTINMYLFHLQSKARSEFKDKSEAYLRGKFPQKRTRQSA